MNQTRKRTHIAQHSHACLSARFLAGLVFVVGIVLQPGAHATLPSEQCSADLDDARDFMIANDAGATALLADHGPAIAQAYETAQTAVAQAEDDETCFRVLQTYLSAWRFGHLGIAPGRQGSILDVAAQSPTQNIKTDPRAPRLQLLDKHTLLLTLPTFFPAYGDELRHLLAKQRHALESHRNWIIDVRRNDGGGDSTFEPLLPWLLDGELRSQSVEYLATPANIEAWEDICGYMSDPAPCLKEVAPIVAAMRKAQPGSFVLNGDRVFVEHIKPERRRPARVAVLIDKLCGSSCEQFVLEARTGSRVKIVGRPTAGMLDVSNLRPHPLPSGRLLFYATTRSTRLPDMRIDGIGIAPDILLEKPSDDSERIAEVKRVQHWLEGGSLQQK